MNVPKQADSVVSKNIEQITALEDLNQTVRVVTIRGWICFALIALFAIGAIVWSFMGTIPITVSGKCVVSSQSSSSIPRFLCFLPLFSGEQVHPGMKAIIALNTIDSALYGLAEGVVKEVFPYPVDANDPLLQSIPSTPLRQYLTQGTHPTLLLIIEPVIDPLTPTGIKWTSPTGPPEPISEGAVGEIDIILNNIRPISYVIPHL